MRQLADSAETEGEQYEMLLGRVRAITSERQEKAKTMLKLKKSMRKDQKAYAERGKEGREVEQSLSSCLIS